MGHRIAFLVLGAAVALSHVAPCDATPPSVPTPSGHDAIQRPFGSGQRVEVTCDEPDAYVFVAQGVVDDRPSFPDPFKKVGRIPVGLELPPGVYTLLVEGDRLTSQSTVFEVRKEPVAVRVHAGSQGMRDLSTLGLALGSAALIAGAVTEVSGTGRGDSDKKHKITIPLFIAGGVAFSGSLALYFVSASSIEHDGYVPQGGGEHASVRMRGLGVSGRF